MESSDGIVAELARQPSEESGECGYGSPVDLVFGNLWPAKPAGAMYVDYREHCGLGIESGP